MIKTKEEKLIVIISSLIALLLSLSIVAISFFVEEVKWTWCFSIVLGQLTSVGCFLKSNAIITKVLYDEVSSAKFLLILNNVLGTICYVIILVVNLLIPIFNIIVCCIGILLLKFTTFVVGIFSKSEVK